MFISKVFEILSSDKYYGQFKTTSQYLKVLSEIDPTDSLVDNSGLYYPKKYFLFIRRFNLDAVSLSSTNSNEISGDYTESHHNPLMATLSGSSTSSSHSPIPDLLDNINNYSITTEINDSGRTKISFSVSFK